MFNQAQRWKKYLSKKYLSLNTIKHTCYDVINLLHIYIYIYKICKNIKPPTPTNIAFSVQLTTWRRLED